MAFCLLDVGGADDFAYLRCWVDRIANGGVRVGVLDRKGLQPAH